MRLKAYVEKVERIRKGVSVEFSFEEPPNENCGFSVHLSIAEAREFYAGQAIVVDVRPAEGKT